MVLNPDVVVRSRGVMEKCSLCVQRIQAGKLAAEADGTRCRRRRHPDRLPAGCARAGDRVRRSRRIPAAGSRRRAGAPRRYRVLEELGTRPIVGYLTKVQNAR